MKKAQTTAIVFIVLLVIVVILLSVIAFTLYNKPSTTGEVVKEEQEEKEIKQKGGEHQTEELNFIALCSAVSRFRGNYYDFDGECYPDDVHMKKGEIFYFYLLIENSNPYPIECDVTEYYNNQRNDAFTKILGVERPEKGDTQYMGIEPSPNNYRNVKYEIRCYKEDELSLSKTKKLIFDINWG